VNAEEKHLGYGNLTQEIAAKKRGERPDAKKEISAAQLGAPAYTSQEALFIDWIRRCDV
jgi:hypothetical protein